MKHFYFVADYTSKYYLNVDNILISAGSVCARKGNHLTIRKILTELYAYVNRPLHAFGLSLTYLKDPQIFNSLYSADSAAWNWGISRHEDKARAVADYQKKIRQLIPQGIQLKIIEESEKQ